MTKTRAHSRMHTRTHSQPTRHATRCTASFTGRSKALEMRTSARSQSSPLMYVEKRLAGPATEPVQNKPTRPQIPTSTQSPHILPLAPHQITILIAYKPLSLSHPFLSFPFRPLNLFYDTAYNITVRPPKRPLSTVWCKRASFDPVQSTA